MCRVFCVCQARLKLSSKVNECKPLVNGFTAWSTEDYRGDGVQCNVERLTGRGLHSSTFQLNLSALYGIGGVRKGLCSPC